MASLQVKAGGVWRVPTQVWVKAGGSWRSCKEVWIKSGGTWRQAFGSGVVSSFSAWNILGISAVSSNATATITFQSNGQVTGAGAVANSTTPGSPLWFSPATTGAGSTYWIKCTPNSGTPTTGATGTWLQLSSDRAWVKSGTIDGTCTLGFQIATDSGGSNIVFSVGGNVLTASHS